MDKINIVVKFRDIAEGDGNPISLHTASAIYNFLIDEGLLRDTFLEKGHIIVKMGTPEVK